MNQESRSVNMILSNEEVFYKILPAKIYGPKGSAEILVFIDEGANVTLIDSDLMNLIGHTKKNSKKTKMTVKWFGEMTITETSEIVSLSISALGEQDASYTLDDVRTTKHLDLPMQSVDSTKLAESYTQFKNILPQYTHQRNQNYFLA